MIIDDVVEVEIFDAVLAGTARGADGRGDMTSREESEIDTCVGISTERGGYDPPTGVGAEVPPDTFG